ncbi:Ger(x)C family spore germination protein [Cohnella sp. REN36]|uniref:Ger(x)C family spore germination protein n=1 Tax=Cohnella sp. REN36 TaxID=2887347 RepID=UPI001D1398EF|nr:Ger(x)C family spore germination protein [Cohnella sp. REN36]MCC3376850.1 Ger(x)C family spore germination protein [Cohnella sp. REN36]
MRIKGFAILAAATLLLLLATGCWNRQELNELGIVVAMGIDRDGDRFRVSVQVVQPGEVAAKSGGQSLRSPVAMYEASGRTIFEALRKMTTVSPRKIYASHLRVVVIGEALARQGIGTALDFLQRDHQVRSDFYLMVAKETTASSILNVLTPMERIPANDLYASNATAEKAWAPIFGITLGKFVTDLGSDGKQPVITGIGLNGDAEEGSNTRNVERIRPAAELQFSGMAVFRKDKLVGWLNEEESKSYNFILGNVRSTLENQSCPNGGELALEIIRTKANVKGHVRRGEPQVEIRLRVEENVGEIQCRIDLNKTAVVDELERRSEDRLREAMSKTIRKMQTEYQLDIFGFGQAIHRADPAAWRRLKRDWDRNFADMQVKLDVKTVIDRVGTINQSFLSKLEE